MAYTYDDIKSSLQQARIFRGDVILLHSSLLDLGKMKDVAAKDAPIKVADAIIEYLGPEGTLVCPGFSWEFYRGNSYSVHDTPCEPWMGILNENLRKRKGSTRTCHAGQSLVCYGKLAKKLADESLNFESAWDKRGPVGLMEANNAKTVMLGPPIWGSCSIIHYVEEELNVPYRYWKTFTGQYKGNNSNAFETKSYQFFARKLEPFEWRTRMEPVEVLMKDANVLTSAKLGKGSIVTFSWSTFIPTLRAKIRADPYFLAIALPPIAKEVEVPTVNVAIPADTFKSWLDNIPKKTKDMLGLTKIGKPESGLELRVKKVLNTLLDPNFVKSINKESSLLDGGLDSVSFVTLVEKMNEEFGGDVTETAKSLQALTVYGSLIEACKLATSSKQAESRESSEGNNEELEEETLLNFDVSTATPIRVVLIGVGKALHTLVDKLLDSKLYEKIKILCIFSNTKDAALQRKSKGSDIAFRSHNEMATKHVSSCKDFLITLHPDVLFSVNNLKHIKDPILDCFPKGCFNLHPGKLPEYAGLHVAQWAIRNGETESAATLHWMISGIDEGPTAYVNLVEIKDNDTGLSLLQKCMKKGVILVIKCIVDLLLGHDVPKLTPNKELFHCYRTSHARVPYILWNIMDQTDINNFIRAADYGPVESPTYSPKICYREMELELKTKDIQCLPLFNHEAEPGEVVAIDIDGVYVQCMVRSGILLIKSGQKLAENGKETVKGGPQVASALGIKTGNILWDHPDYQDAQKAFDIYFASSCRSMSLEDNAIRSTQLRGGIINWNNLNRDSPLVKRVAIMLKNSQPILRSITGHGVRQTHQMLSEVIPLTCFEIASGTEVFEWLVPKEWVMNEAYIANSAGKRIIDVKNHGLHLMSYSSKFRGKLSNSDLQKHLMSLPKQPEAIPYATTYYTDRWKFCLSHNDRINMTDAFYDVVVDTEKKSNGSLTLSEAVLKGQSEKEIFISAYTCHPYMCNDSLSGAIVAAFLYEKLAQMPKEKRKYTYRFVFIPETIGAVAYLKLKGNELKSNVVAGYVLTCIGDSGYFTYKRSRQKTSIADIEMIKHLKSYIGPTDPYGENKGVVHDFWCAGSDERQYCSPAFNLPIGCVCRSMYGHFKEYHTSTDDMTFVKPEYLAESVNFMYELFMKLEKLDMTVASMPERPSIFPPISATNVPISGMSRFVSLVPYGEPQLGRRGMYYTTGSGHRSPQIRISAILWLLAYSTGAHPLKQIAFLSKRHYQDTSSKSVTTNYMMESATVEDLVLVAKELMEAKMIKRLC